MKKLLLSSELEGLKDTVSDQFTVSYMRTGKTFPESTPQLDNGGEISFVIITRELQSSKTQQPKTQLLSIFPNTTTTEIKQQFSYTTTMSPTKLESFIQALPDEFGSKIKDAIEAFNEANQNNIFAL